MNVFLTFLPKKYKGSFYLKQKIILNNNKKKLDHCRAQQRNYSTEIPSNSLEGKTGKKNLCVKLTVQTRFNVNLKQKSHIFFRLCSSFVERSMFLFALIVFTGIFWTSVHTHTHTHTRRLQGADGAGTQDVASILSHSTLSHPC